MRKILLFICAALIMLLSSCRSNSRIAAESSIQPEETSVPGPLCEQAFTKDVAILTHETAKSTSIRFDRAGFSVQLMAGKLDVTTDARRPCELLSLSYIWTQRSNPLTLYVSKGKIRFVQLRNSSGRTRVIVRDTLNRTLTSNLDRTPRGLVMYRDSNGFQLGIGYRMASEDVQSIGVGPNGPYLYFSQGM
jgi:hypothetical protein